MPAANTVPSVTGSLCKVRPHTARDPQCYVVILGNVVKTTNDGLLLLALTSHIQTIEPPLYVWTGSRWEGGLSLEYRDERVKRALSRLFIVWHRKRTCVDRENYSRYIRKWNLAARYFHAVKLRYDNSLFKNVCVRYKILVRCKKARLGVKPKVEMMDRASCRRKSFLNTSNHTDEKRDRPMGWYSLILKSLFCWTTPHALGRQPLSLLSKIKCIVIISHFTFNRKQIPNLKSEQRGIRVHFCYKLTKIRVLEMSRREGELCAVIDREGFSCATDLVIVDIHD